MTVKNQTTTENLQPEECISYRLRRAGRMAAKFYDNALKPSGLRNTQFALLATIYKAGEISIGDLSEATVTDGTTLTRNLEVVIRRELVENIEIEDGRVRLVRLTQLGNKTFKEAVPLWREAQEHALRILEPGSWTKMMGQLEKIEEI